MNNMKTAVALGNFDGLHIGHMAVLHGAQQARTAGLLPTVLLFSSHPQEVLTGEAPPELLQPSARDALLAELDLTVRKMDFAAIRELSPEQFFREILCNSLNASLLCCGYNYRFGKGGKGDAKLLEQLCAESGVSLFTAPQVDYDGAPVSASRIRRCLAQGELPQVNAMLGRAFGYTLPVVSGDRRGRLLGWPTINQIFPPGFILPRLGVYVSEVTVEGERRVGVTNIGSRPTFGGTQPRSETCILNYSGDLYGQEIRTELRQFLRPERKFANEEELKACIAQDARAAVAFRL